MLTLTITMAERERDLLSERTKQGTPSSQGPGVHVGRPFRDIKMEEVNAKREQGMTLAEIAEEVRHPRKHPLTQVQRDRDRPLAYLPLHHHAEQTHNNAHMEQQYQSGRVFSFHNYKFIFIYRQGGQIKIREFSPFWRPTRFYKNLKKMGFFGK